MSDLPDSRTGAAAARAKEPHLMADEEYRAMFHQEDQLWWYRGLRQFLAKVLQSKSPEGRLLLDAGCGTGRNLQHYGELGYRAVGMDLSPRALKSSRQRGHDRLILGSVTQLPYPSNTFDVVSSMDVIYMLGNDEVHDTLAEALRVLRPGGFLVLNVCALESLRSQHDVLVGTRKRYTRRDLELALKSGAQKSGVSYRVERLGYRVGLLLPLIAGVKWIKQAQLALGAEAKTDQEATPGLANGPLTAVMGLENWLLARGLPMPLGSSVYMVVQKN